MKNTNSLEDFIKTYVTNKILSESKESYASWLKKNCVNSKAIYEKDLIGAETAYEKSKSEYGDRAERLASIGLSSGGYSDYLNGKAYEEMQKSKESAKDRYLENERQNAAGYDKYSKAYDESRYAAIKDYATMITDMNEKQSSLYTGVIKDVSAAGITDYDTAFIYAKNAGLDDEYAASAAKTATEEAKRERNSMIMETVITKNMTESQARQYALSLGLSSDESEKIAVYARNINDLIYSSDFGGGSGSILDDFKNQVK